MPGMPEFPLQDVIDGLKARLQSELDTQIAALQASHEQALTATREAAEAEAESRVTACMDAAQAEWSARLEAEVAAARADADRHLATETARARLDAEQAAAEAAATARAEFDQILQRALAEERQRAEQGLERALAEERQRAEQVSAAQAPDGSAPDLARLLQTVTAIGAARSLSDVLARTVSGAAAEAPRAALFVANGPQLEEWAADPLPPLSSGIVRHDGQEAGVLGAAAVTGELALTGNGTAAPDFARLDAGRSAIAVPLLVGGQPVAVLYADDGGEAGAGAPSGWREAMEIIGRHASACLAYLTAVRTADAIRLMDDAATSSRAEGQAGNDQAARRYAKLLVSEIKLYNEAAVRIGREKRDLLRRLKPEIERARRLYDQRVPPGFASRDACFQLELVQTLADGDAALLG